MRKLRMQWARERGTHTKEEWEALCAEFDFRCVRCARNLGFLERDHIVPIYQGGCDCILNIQPLCPFCNVQKGPENYNWAAHRRRHGWAA
jgi:5-methylcytosine-specific restriction endonuclease McrA